MSQGPPVDVNIEWTFEQYQAYEQDREAHSCLEQEQARSNGLVADPKTAPHGGYRIACVWPKQVTQQACELSARLSALVPETPAYPYEAIHSSVCNIAAPGDRVVDPQHPEDRKTLDALAAAAEAALATDLTADREVRFDRGFLAPRMAFIFGRLQPGYWSLHQAIHRACAAAAIDVVGSWGPHLTLTRFGSPASPEQAKPVLDQLATWRPVTASPIEVLIGYYTVEPNAFRVGRVSGSVEKEERA